MRQLAASQGQWWLHWVEMRPNKNELEAAPSSWVLAAGGSVCIGAFASTLPMHAAVPAGNGCANSFGSLMAERIYDGSNRERDKQARFRVEIGVTF